MQSIDHAQIDQIVDVISEKSTLEELSLAQQSSVEQDDEDSEAQQQEDDEEEGVQEDGEVDSLEESEEQMEPLMIRKENQGEGDTSLQTKEDDSANYKTVKVQSPLDQDGAVKVVMRSLLLFKSFKDFPN